MKSMKSIVSIILLLTIVITSAKADNYLFSNGRAEYDIVVGVDASVSEKTAASEFQGYIRQIGNVTLPIVSQGKARKHVYIGWTEKTGVPRPDDADEGYTYRTIGDDLYIYGGRDRGTMYGVFAFLERELGVHWYTSTYTKIPRMKQFVLQPMEHSERPAIRLRLDFYYDAVRNNDWASHNMINTRLYPAETKYGYMTATWGVHTFAQLIPPSVYFKEHPEYFAVYKGKRSDKTQLCLSNEEMCKELTKNFAKIIRENPGHWCYDVSQNDNRYPCECSKCEKLVAKYGGQSGAMLWFVNRVAAEIKKVFPDVYVGTLAYQYTRQAPTSTIKPADNVVIRLCDIECCMAHPLNECERNKTFLRDLDNWNRITKNVYIWDYTTGFRHYLIPFPNFDVLARNYQYLSQSNVIGILELGSWNAPWSEFSELKQWMIAKLLWNPRLSTDSLAALFIKDYYGSAAPHVQKYYDLCRRQVTADTHFAINIEWDTELYNDGFLTDADKILKKAVAVSRDKETRKRVNRLAAQCYYMQLRRHTIGSVTNGTAQQLIDIMRNDSTIVRESGIDIDQLMYDMGYH